MKMQALKAIHVIIYIIIYKENLGKLRQVLQGVMTLMSAEGGRPWPVRDSQIDRSCRESLGIDFI